MGNNEKNIIINTIVFTQIKDDSHKVTLNNKQIDFVGMNYKKRYTQGHLAIAKVAKTLECKIEDLIVIVKSDNGYPFKELKEMAKSLSRYMNIKPYRN